MKDGGIVMVLMPGSVEAKAWKLVSHNYRTISATPTSAEVLLVDQTGADAIFVDRSRVHSCYSEMADVSWSSNQGRAKSKPTKTVFLQVM